MSHPRHFSARHEEIEGGITEQLRSNPCAAELEAMNRCIQEAQRDWSACQNQIKALRACQAGTPEDRVRRARRAEEEAEWVHSGDAAAARDWSTCQKQIKALRACQAGTPEDRVRRARRAERGCRAHAERAGWREPRRRTLSARFTTSRASEAI